MWFYQQDPDISYITNVTLRYGSDQVGSRDTQWLAHLELNGWLTMS